MIQIEGTIQRTHEATYETFESPILLRAADMVPYDEDDRVMDSWLASMDPREFELILSRLAESSAQEFSRLEPTA